MNTFETQEFSDFDLEASMAQPIVVPTHETDESATRYGFSFLVNIPLYKHTGNNALLDASKRDETGSVIKNTMYFPRLMLMPFRNLVSPIPAEVPASRTSSGSYEANMRVFNPEVADAQDTMLRTSRKTALKCAELFQNTYGKEGGIILNSLTGIESYARAKDLLMAVLPLNDTGLFPRFVRNVLGEEFISPFLDGILEYLQSPSARERINDYNDYSDDRRFLPQLYNEVLAGARNANTIAKGQISTSEQQMSASPQQKSGYDIRDTQFAGAPDPTDLVCLAHRNEHPKSERTLEQARKMQETNNEPLAEVAKSMNAVAELMLANQQNQQVQQQPAPVGMTAAQIAELVRTQVASGIEDFKRETAQQVADTPAPHVFVDISAGQPPVVKTTKAATPKTS